MKNYQTPNIKTKFRQIFDIQSIINNDGDGDSGGNV